MLKKLALIAAVTLGMVGAAFADPVEGTWKTQPGDDGAYGYISVAKCGAKICGVIAKAFDGSGTQIQSDNLGKQMIWNMSSNGDGTYSGGKIWAPDRNKTYNSRMALSGNTLEVKGCVLGICRGQTWTRVR